ncbi:protein phosphatase [Angomonas deanei]|uniref:Protein phosphatase 2C, putative n=1 Tax=Angomonas deanei TaxID=59799 RepID=A0A7G2CP29_9TRYP|nr:protein phosphatase [Angomonas deanei]CAD2221540.1 Protein phosphatase 2C, putative [Angomonas deanei]|eukprot:EPY29766.1 protein phosphatase [Angomonas deanei]
MSMKTLAQRGNTQTILMSPVKDKYSILMEDDKLRVGASSMQGWRSTMEDAHVISLSLPHLPSGIVAEDAALAAVFDGHCGSKFAQSCAANVLTWLTTAASFKAGRYGVALRDAYLAGDAALHKSMPNELSGCTGNSILLVQNHLYCANTGDSRAVLCRDGVAIPLSEDHKPTNQSEEIRINKAGGFVHAGRVNGVLSLSRAFGDYAFKDVSLPPEKMAITVVPDVKHVELTPQDEFVIIACDGVWDVLSNEACVEFVRGEVADHGDISLACERVMNNCLAAAPTSFGTDNMTIVILQFKSSFLKKVEERFLPPQSEEKEGNSPQMSSSPTESKATDKTETKEAVKSPQ